MSLYPKRATVGSSNNCDNSTTEKSHPALQSENSTSGCISLMIPTHLQRRELYEENLTVREEVKSTFNQSPRALFRIQGGAQFPTSGSQRHHILDNERVAIMLQHEEFIAELR